MPSSKRYLLKWTVACGVGEFIGIGIAAGISFSFFILSGEPDNLAEKSITMLLAVVAGIIEGLVTGSLQWTVLREKFTDMRAKNWLFFTAAGAATGWILGMLFPTFLVPSASSSSAPAEPSSAMIALLSAGSGVFLGAVFGSFQWLEFKKHAEKASRWIVANTIGWIIGMTAIYLGASTPSTETGLGIVVVIGAISGIIAGLCVGAITGAFLIRINPVTNK